MHAELVENEFLQIIQLLMHTPSFIDSHIVEDGQARKSPNRFVCVYE